MMMISKIMKWNMMNYNQINQFCLIKNDNNILFVDSGQCILIVPIFISRVEVH